MSRYDEDLYENPFFDNLEKNNSDLFAKATSNRWIICIPKFAVVEKEKLNKKDFEDHILIPDVDHEGRFTTVSKNNVTIQNLHINLGSGFKDFKQVEILFEEVFYNKNDESYRVLCVEQIFNRESLVQTYEDGSVWAKPPSTYDECLIMLWSRAGSGKTKDHVDKALLSFCAAYQRYEGDSIDNLADLVSNQITDAMRLILKDQSIRRAVTSNDTYMINLKIAAEMYIMNATHKHLFSTITACVKTEDAAVNKMTRNLAELRLHHLGVRKEFEENLPTARKELSALNQFSTPLGRLLCLKRVMTALTKPLGKAKENEGLVMTTDDFLPLLIYLIIKSQINNWTANLMYMKYFQQARVSDSDIFSFYLTTTEAALDYIKSGEVKADNTGGSPQKMSRPVSGTDSQGFKRQTSGGGSSTKSKFFQYVQYGDETAVTLMLKKPDKENDDTLSQLCHPLCSCEKCSELVNKSKNSAREVSVTSRNDMGRTALHLAAFYGQAGLIDILVKQGSLADASDYLGCTPLHLACQKGYQNIILLLVHFGADIGTIDNEGNTPLHLCAKNGHEDCVKAILFLDILKSKLNVNAQNDFGDTPLHLAAKWGYEGIVKFLLETEGDARIRNRKRQTPLSLAQNPAIKRMLQTAFDDPPPIIVKHPVPTTLNISRIRRTSSSKSDASPSSSISATSPSPRPSKSSTSSTPRTDKPATPRTDKPDTPRSTKPSTPRDKKPATPRSTKPTTPQHAQSNGLDSKNPLGFEVVDVKPARPPVQLIDNSDSRMMSPKTAVVASLDKIDPRQVERLFSAISNKDIELIKFYLGWMDSPESEEGDSPRQEEPGSLCHPLCQCSKCQPIQKISSSTSLSVNCCNKKGFTPLHIAVIERYMEAFKLFLKKGANINMQTHRNITALHLACFHSNMEMVEMLVSRGADVNLEDQHGEIPLHLAAAKNNVQIVQVLLQHSSSVNLCNVDGNTPLHRAAASNAVESVELLLRYDAKPTAMNKNNQLPHNLTKSKDIQELLLQKHIQNQGRKDEHTAENIIAATAQTPTAKQEDHKFARLQELLSSVETKDLQARQQLGESIRDFNMRDSLKRSKTFDHSHPVLQSPQLKLSLSIKNFNKTKSLKRCQTLDKSLPHLDLFKHSLRIQHFDSDTLRHVDPVDKSSPMYLYNLAQSTSSYTDYLDTPVEAKEPSFPNSAQIDQTVSAEGPLQPDQTEPPNCDKTEISDTMKEDVENAEELEQLQGRNTGDIEHKNDNNNEFETVKGQEEIQIERGDENEVVSAEGPKEVKVDGAEDLCAINNDDNCDDTVKNETDKNETDNCKLVDDLPEPSDRSNEEVNIDNAESKEHQNNCSESNGKTGEALAVAKTDSGNVETVDDKQSDSGPDHEFDKLRESMLVVVSNKSDNVVLTESCDTQPTGETIWYT